MTDYRNRFHRIHGLTAIALLTFLPLSGAVNAAEPAPATETVLKTAFSSPADTAGWTLGSGTEIVKDADGTSALEVKTDNGKTITGARQTLDSFRLGGKRLILSAEIKRAVELPEVRWQGAKLMLSYNSGGKSSWPSVYLPHGDFDWQPHRLELDLPLDAENVAIFLGIQSARGRVLFRNLKLESSDYTLHLEPLANMGFKDKTAGDGQGGWSDQGPENDAARFDFKKKEYGGIPFHLADPNRNQGKAVMVFKSSRFPQGLEKAELKLDAAEVSARYLYLLHTMTWGYAAKDTVGYIDLTGKNGKTQTIAIRPDRDIADWWTPKNRVNAYPAASWGNNAGGIVGVYRSKFELNPELGSLASIRFRSSASTPVWIVLGATLGNHDYPAPRQEACTIKAGPEWSPLPFPPTSGVVKGSALDLSWLNPRQIDRVIVNADGLFARAGDPAKPLRFMSTVLITDPYIGRGKEKPDFTDKTRIEQYTEQLYRSGYNMVRIHYPDATFMIGGKRDFELNPDFLDKFDYFVHCLKQRGMYLNIDAMASRIGWSHGYSWSAKPGDLRSFKLDIHFNPEVRQNWFTGVKTFLTHLNPYTKTRLVDDPVLAMMVAFNEQEFGFVTPGNLQQVNPRWQEFLRKRYADIAELNRAWSSNYDSFAAAGDFTLSVVTAAGTRGMDAARFLTAVERDTYTFYRNSVREIGFKGPIAAYNMGQTLRYALVRSDMDYVAMNGYHAHPHGNSINTRSGISMASPIIRGFSACRQYRHPFLVTEHSHGYWNMYHYEQGLTMGAYASLQNFSGLTSHSNPVTLDHIPRVVKTFTIKTDPIGRASEFITALMYLRRDVKTADTAVRYQLHPEALYRNGSINDALNSDQSRMALVCRISIETARPDVSAGAGELLLTAIGGAPIRFAAYSSTGVGGFTQAGESKKSISFDFDREIAGMKRKNLLPAANRSNLKSAVFESVTGEIFMDCRKNFLSVNTPRVQGVCAEPGTKARLRDFEVVSHTTRGALTVAGIDGNQSIAEANRLLLICSTNVMNTGDTFSDASRQTRLKTGTPPILLNTGRFHVRIRNRNAARLRCYALDMDGTRRREIPVRADRGTVEIKIDTSVTPALYFELSK